MCSFISLSNLKFLKLASDFFESFVGDGKDYEEGEAEAVTLIEDIKKFPSDYNNMYQFEDYTYAEDYSYVEEEVNYEELFEEYKKQFKDLGKEVKKVGDKVKKEIKEAGDKVRKYEEKLFKSALDTVTGKLNKKIDEKKWLFDTLFHLWLGILEAKKELLYKLWLKKKGKKKGRSNEHYEFVIPYYVYSTTYKPHLYHEHEEPKVLLKPKHVPNPRIRGKYESNQGDQYAVTLKSENGFQPSFNDEQIVDEVYKDTSKSNVENDLQESYIDVTDDT